MMIKLSKKCGISEYPTLSFTDFCKPNKHRNIFLDFYKKNAYLFYLGRGALFHAIKLLNLENSEKVLVPSYHCGIDIESIIIAGADIEYYNIDEKLDIDIKDLVSKIDNHTKAIVVTHYFGFPQSIEILKEICRRYDLVLIEDCAHALFSSHKGIPLGLYGDVSVFSQRKSLPLPDGGALLLVNSKLCFSSKVNLPNKFIICKVTIGMLSNSIIKKKYPYFINMLIALKWVTSKLTQKYIRDEYNTGMDISLKACNIAMSGVSLNLMSRIEIKSIIHKRRLNYEYILNHFPKSNFVDRIFVKLPDGVCPLFFPIRISFSKREEVQKKFNELNIQTYIFGEELHKSLRKKLYPDAVKHSKEILCLPIHQNLSNCDVENILTALKNII